MDRWSQWKANVALRIPLVASAPAIFTNPNPHPTPRRPPALLPAIPAGAHFTFIFTSHRAPLALSSLSISAGRTDAQESRQRRTELTQQTSHHRPPPPAPLRTPRTSAPLLSLFHFHYYPFISSDLSSASFLSCRPSRRDPALSVFIAQRSASLPDAELSSACENVSSRRSAEIWDWSYYRDHFYYSVTFLLSLCLCVLIKTKL